MSEAHNQLKPAEGSNLEFNPLLKENVIEREYTGLNINVDPTEIIPEATFEAPPFESPTDSIENDNSFKEERTFNKEYTELPNKEKKEGAELMADAIIDGYASLIGYAGNLAVISESKLEQEIIEGTISAETTLQIDEQGKRISVREYVNSYNEQAKEAFTVTQEFKEIVKPPLTRVLQKRGAALTDEQFLAYHFGKDVLEKGVTAFAIKSQNKQILSYLRENKQTPTISPPEPYIENESTRFNDSEIKIVPAAENDVKPKRQNTQRQKPNILTEEEVFSTEPLKANGFSEAYVAPAGMPEHGNPDLLAHMEKASKIGNKAVAKQKAKKPHVSK